MWEGQEGDASPRCPLNKSSFEKNQSLSLSKKKPFLPLGLLSQAATLNLALLLLAHSDSFHREPWRLSLAGPAHPLGSVKIPVALAE